MIIINIIFTDDFEYNSVLTRTEDSFLICATGDVCADYKTAVEYSSTTGDIVMLSSSVDEFVDMNSDKYEWSENGLIVEKVLTE